MVKILSNFDTNLAAKIMRHHGKVFDEQDIIYIRRSSIYLIMKVIIPFLLWLIIAVAAMVFVYSFFGNGSTLERIIRLGARIIFGISFMFVAYRLIYLKTIDHYMDFALVTPREIIAVDQSGFFLRQERSLDSIKIKAIRVEKNGILSSIFDFGSLVFFSDSDAVENMGDIKLNYIFCPEKVKAKVLRVIDHAHYSYAKHG